MGCYMTTLAALYADGSVLSICVRRQDSIPPATGRADFLRRHYSDPDVVNELLAHGDCMCGYVPDSPGDPSRQPMDTDCAPGVRTALRYLEDSGLDAWHFNMATGVWLYKPEGVGRGGAWIDPLKAAE